jgi:pyruvate dehydrogenase E2 component (dihydrolipoamide acetyltransferase)/2-oxoisovalerate dehydrogenase E2 component (dihydrolipoyl transacylase)
MDFHLPELGEGVYEAELVAWLVKPGDTVKRGQNLMEVLTDKATMEVPSPFAGTITALQAKPGDQIKVGQVVLSHSAAGQPEEAPGQPALAGSDAADGKQAVRAARGPAASPVVAFSKKAESRSSPSLPSNQAVKAAPSVRYMARKLGIDLAQVQGSGSQGRILIEDLSAFVKPTSGDGQRQPLEPRPDYGTPGTRIRLQGLRRRIAEHMVLAKRTIPHYSYVDECEVTDLVRLRQVLRETYAQAGVRLTYLAFLVKAAVAALKEVPIVNATLDEAASEIVLHEHYHIGIAVATPGGLIVPVVRDADQKDLTQVARDIERLSSEARAGKIRLEDLRGGSFTVTSVGNIGGLISTPVINHPEVAILGVGKLVKRPVYDTAGNIRPADLVYLSLSFDHRVVDGAVGAAFGNALIRQLQNPARLLLPEKLA